MVTVFGRQQKAEVGYNPRYRGKRSYNPLLCLEAKTPPIYGIPNYVQAMLARHVELLASCFVNIPPDIREVRVRADAGFDFHPFWKSSKPERRSMQLWPA